MLKEKFNGKNCIVTGGAGFIGSSLVEALISNGANVKIIDNFSVGKQNVDFLNKIGAKYSFIHTSTNHINKRRIIGEISKAPRLGKKRLIYINKGSVSRYVKSKTK